MNMRTDLALEIKQGLAEGEDDGIESIETQGENSKITKINITTKTAEEKTGKPIGTYITVEVPSFTKDSELFDGRLTSVSEELKKVIPADGTVLVVGLGNESITPDALGPKAASYIFATRHIQGEIAKSAGLENVRPVAVLSPGVLGQTGMETAEIIKSLVESIKPSVLIVIDALASRSVERLGCTVQIADTGISPGAGVGNMRTEINEKTVGVPVISMGVPTVEIIQYIKRSHLKR